MAASLPNNPNAGRAAVSAEPIQDAVEVQCLGNEPHFAARLPDRRSRGAWASEFRNGQNDAVLYKDGFTVCDW